MRLRRVSYYLLPVTILRQFAYGQSFEPRHMADSKCRAFHLRDAAQGRTIARLVVSRAVKDARNDPRIGMIGVSDRLCCCLVYAADQM